MSRKNLVVLVVFLLAIAGFFIRYYGFSSSAKAYEFTGSIQKVDDRTIYMRGNYSSPDHPEWRADANRVDVKVRIGSNTKLVRITIHRPANFAAQIKVGKVIDPKVLKQEVAVGSLADLVSGKVSGATIETSSNIYNHHSFTAASITYYYPVDDK